MTKPVDVTKAGSPRPVIPARLGDDGVLYADQEAVLRVALGEAARWKTLLDRLAK